MVFLANENYPGPSIKYLRNKGLNVICISEGFRGISDKEVLQKAINENLIILTFDRDYGELIFKYAPENPPSVIYFRIKGSTPTEAGQLLLDLLMENTVVFEGYFTVIEQNGIRQRKL